MSYAAPPSFTSGSTLTAAQMNVLGDDILETAPAKVTTKGDIVAATGANSLSRVAVGGDYAPLIGDSTQTQGVRFAPYRALYLVNATIGDVLVSNTTTETTLLSTTIAAGVMGTTDGLRVRILGTYRNHKGSNGTITLRFKFGGATAISLAITATENATAEANRQFALEWTIYNTTASAQTEGAEARFYTSGAVDYVLMDFTTQTKNTAIDTALVVTAQLSAADTTFLIRQKMATIELV